MSSTSRSLAPAALLLLCSCLTAETVELTNGEVLIGQVLEMAGDQLKMEVVYPDTGAIRELTRDQVTPESLYVILALRSDPEDPGAHMELARTCQQLGLPAHAIAEYRKASRLDPAMEEECATKIQEIVLSVARRLLTEAQQDLKDKRHSAVELALQLIIKRFPDTPAAEESRKLLEQVQGTRQTRAQPTRRVRPEHLGSAIWEAERNEERAKQAGLTKLEEFSNDIIYRRQLMGVVDNLERGYSILEGIIPPTEDPELAQKLVATQERLRKQLLEHTLVLCTAWIRARAMPSAQRCNERAFELAPDDPRCVRMHDLILQGQMTRDWGGRVR